MGKRKRKSATNVDAAPAAVTPPTESRKKGKRGGNKAVENEVVGSEKQGIVNGGVELAVEGNTFGTEIQKEQTNLSEVDAAAVVTSPTGSRRRGKKRSKKAVENEVVGSKKQQIANGGVELAAEENTFETETQKEQTNFSKVHMGKEEQSKVDAAPAALTPPTESRKRGKKRAKKAVEKEVQKQEIVNGGVEPAVEKNTFETESQKEQTNFSEVREAEEQNKVEVAPTNEPVVIVQDAKKASSNSNVDEHKGDSSKEDDPKKSVEVAPNNESLVTVQDATKASSKDNVEEHRGDSFKEDDPKKSVDDAVANELAVTAQGAKEASIIANEEMKSGYIHKEGDDPKKSVLIFLA